MQRFAQRMDHAQACGRFQAAHSKRTSRCTTQHVEKFMKNLAFNSKQAPSSQRPPTMIHRRNANNMYACTGLHSKPPRVSSQCPRPKHHQRAGFMSTGSTHTNGHPQAGDCSSTSRAGSHGAERRFNHQVDSSGDHRGPNGSRASWRRTTGRPPQGKPCPHPPEAWAPGRSRPHRTGRLAEPRLPSGEVGCTARRKADSSH